MCIISTASHFTGNGATSLCYFLRCPLFPVSFGLTLLQIHLNIPIGEQHRSPIFSTRKFGARTQRHPNSTRYAPMCSSEPAEKSLPRLWSSLRASQSLKLRICSDFPKALHREMAWGNHDPSWDEHEHELSLA